MTDTSLYSYVAPDYSIDGTTGDGNVNKLRKTKLATNFFAWHIRLRPVGACMLGGGACLRLTPEVIEVASFQDASVVFSRGGVAYSDGVVATRAFRLSDDPALCASPTVLWCDGFLGARASRPPTLRLNVAMVWAYKHGRQVASPTVLWCDGFLGARASRPL